ncbi:MAG TPA: nitroreductase family protein [Clostridium sp.]
MDYVQVDQDKCVKCGLCINVCRGVLEMGSNGPQVAKGICIGCGHCVAACPNEAIDNPKSTLKNQIQIRELANLDQEMASQFLRSRRSVRSYKNIKVPREKIEQLLDIGRFAPTACNSQGISYHVIDDTDTLHKITAATIDWAEEEMKKESSLSASPFAPNTMIQIERYRTLNKDTIIRGASCLVLALCDKNLFSLGRDNTHFSLSYVQLYAQTMGLATCWTGLLEFCANAGYEPLLNLLNIPDGKILTGGIIVGYPIYKYKRLVDRELLKISWK